MLQVTIRRTNQTDYETIYSLICQLVDTEYGAISKPELNKIYTSNLNSNNKEIYVAEMNDLVVGFLSLTYDIRLSEAGKIAVIDEFVVDEKYRDKGIGSYFINFVIEKARKDSCCYIEVATNLKRINTHRFYEKCGFEKTGIDSDTLLRINIAHGIKTITNFI